MDKINIRTNNERAKIDNEKKLVKFYYVTWNKKNDYGEIFLRGASLKTIQSDKTRIKFFKNHDREKAPGVVLELGEDEIGAWASCKLIDTIVGRDTFVEYSEQQITEHSFGFRYVKNGVKYDENADTLFVTDFELREVSCLNGWGADSNTKVIQLNSGESVERSKFIESLKIEKSKINYNSILENFNLSI
jgi:HK97 family phage prohead protease